LLPPAWLSHHRSAHAERCVSVGSVHVCRRCIALWPACFGVLVAAILLRWPVAAPLELVLWLVPPMGEYAAVHAFGWRYAPRRIWVVGPWLGVGLGRAFHRYVLDPGDPVAWASLGAVGAVGALSLWAGRE